MPPPSEPPAPPPGQAPPARDPARFIRDNTRLLAPPLVPEIHLHLAEESLPIWHKTEEELGESGVPPPYWAFAWAGGQALARHLLDNPALVAGHIVLDIGSGSGLVAIAAARAGARRVIANDIDPFAHAACRLNAAANGVTLEVSTADLLANPTALPDGPAEATGNADVITFADVFYEKALARAATDFARAHHRRGAAVLVGDPRRSYFPTDHFRRVADYHVPVTRELEDSEIKSTAVWQFSD